MPVIADSPPKRQPSAPATRDRIDTPRAGEPAPGWDAYWKHARDLRAMQGASFIMWDSTKPADLVTYYATPEFAAMARNVLRPVVDGARMLTSLPVAVPPPHDPVSKPGIGEWWNESSNLVRAVAALPGVADYSKTRTDVTFRTSSAADSARLAGLVQSRLGELEVHWAPKPVS